MCHVPIYHVCMWCGRCTRSFSLLRRRTESTESGSLILNLIPNLNPTTLVNHTHQISKMAKFKIQNEDFVQPLFVLIFLYPPRARKITISPRETPLTSHETRAIEHPGPTDTIGSGSKCSARQVGVLPRGSPDSKQAHSQMAGIERL